MRPSNGLAALARCLGPIAALLVATLAPSAEARGRCQDEVEVRVIVPAYFYPTWWAGSPWDDLNEAAARIPIEAIMNPASGPGTAPNPDYEQAVADFQAAGGTVLGYVSTAYGARPMGDVIRDIAAYFAWYDVDGIFLDEVSNQNGPLNYKFLYHFIQLSERFLGRDLRVVGNAGIPFPQVEPYLGAVDTLVIFEGPLANADPWGASFEAYPTEGPYAGLPLWFPDRPAERLANLVYGVPTAEAMTAALNKAIQFNAGYVYLTDDDISDWNPWDTLPTYWDQMVDAIEAINNAQ